MAEGAINSPAGFGGLMRYNEEYDTKFKLKTSHVIAYIISLVLLVIVLNIFFPIPVQ